MKKALLLILILVSIQISKAQEFYPMALEGAQWIEGIENEWGMGELESIWEHRIIGDTTIDGEDYKKVYKRELILNENQIPPFENAELFYLVAVIRDDSINRKVFAIVFEEYINGSCPLNEEYILYDFSLSIDDVIDFCTYEGYADDILASIDDDFYFGVDSRIYHSNTDHTYHESIGGMNGLFEPIFLPYKKGEFIPTPEILDYCPDSNCGLILGSTVITDQNLTVFPNPTKGMVSFNLPNSQHSCHIEICNLNSQVLKVIDIAEGQDQVTYMLNLSTGVYIYKGISNQKSFVGKIILE